MPVSFAVFPQIYRANGGELDPLQQLAAAVALQLAIGDLGTATNRDCDGPWLRESVASFHCI